MGVHAPAANMNAERTRKLIEILQSNAAFYDKARACQQLGEFGTREAVPALAALLGDEHLCAYARSGLEGIPDPSAAEALRNAATWLTGDRLAGAVESLGVLRDPNAVDLLHKLTDDPAAGVSQQALLALGRIANEASIRILRECLAKGSEGPRTNAAAALLMTAQKQLADGHAEQAMALCDAVRDANVPVVYRAAALRGAIVARKAQGVPLLVEQLRSNEPVVRNAALTAIREIPCEELARALNAEIEQSPAELQKLLLMALVDCHNAQSLQLLGRKAADAAPEIRQTALVVAGRIGGASEVPVLIAAVAQNRSAEESTLAQSALGQIQGAGINEELVQALASSSDLVLRTRLVRVLASRSATNAIPELLRQAAGPDLKVSVAALDALQSLAGPSELPALIALTRDAKDAAVREAAENAVAGECLKTGSALSGTEAVLTELKQANDPSVKNSWVNILISLGESRALPAILVAMNDPNNTVAGNALEQLARWPDPAPMESLLAIVQKDADPARRKRALASAIRLATVAADEHQRPPEMLVKWFQQANAAADSVEERRLIISGLGRVPELESLQLLAPYLNNPDLKEEAAVAVVQIAPALQKESPPALKEALDRIAATAKNKDLRDQASKLAKTIPSQSIK
jgi:HEAT repeat protein